MAQISKVLSISFVTLSIVGSQEILASQCTGALTRFLSPSEEYTKPWAFNLQQGEQIMDAQTAHLSAEDRLRKLADVMLTARADNELSTRRARYFGEKIWTRGGLWNQSHDWLARQLETSFYFPLTNRVGLRNLSPNGVLTLVHESDHFIALNKNFKRYLLCAHAFCEAFLPADSPLLLSVLYHMEGSAIGAEWEILSRLDERDRAEIDTSLTEDNKRLWHAALLNSSLTKDRFITEMRPVHGYTISNMMTKHYFSYYTIGRLIAFSTFHSVRLPWLMEQWGKFSLLFD